MGTKHRISLAARILALNTLSESWWEQMLSSEGAKKPKSASKPFTIPLSSSSAATSTKILPRSKSVVRPLSSLSDVAKMKTKELPAKQRGASRREPFGVTSKSWESYKKQPSSDVESDPAWGRRLMSYTRRKATAKKTPEWQRKLVKKPWGFQGTLQYGAPEQYHEPSDAEKHLPKLPERRPLLLKKAGATGAQSARHGALSLSHALGKKMHVCKSNGSHYTSMKPCPPEHKHVDTVHALKSPKTTKRADL